MKIKHKLISDYQYLSADKKIFLIKSGTIIENYIYRVKSESICIERQIVDANPEIFQIIDWKAELLTYIKSNKLPTPAVLTKKIIPFIEEMVLSSIQQNSQAAPAMDEAQIKELERKETDLNSREKRIKDKEEEVEIRIKRVEKRESDHKEDLSSLDKKEDDLRERSKTLIEKALDLDDKTQDLNERERNLDSAILKSSMDVDSKYAELQKKIESDLRTLSEREKELETKIKSVSKRESRLDERESELADKIRDLEIKTEDIKPWEEELRKLDTEIKSWESLHWKLQKTTRPPSALDG